MQQQKTGASRGLGTYVEITRLGQLPICPSYAWYLQHNVARGGKRGVKQKELNLNDFIEICNINDSDCSVLNVLLCICLLQN